jgi:hypothetical protein
MMLPPNEYLAQKLTPYPLPTKDGGVLRTIGDVRAYTQGTAEDPQAAPPTGSTFVVYSRREPVWQR